MNTGKRISLNSKQLAAAILLLMLVGINSSAWMGLWSTENNKQPGRYEGATEAAGEYRPEDIRGSYTFSEVSAFYGIDAEVLRKAFGLPEDADLAVYQLKNLEALYAGMPEEIGTGSVIAFVALYKNLPYEVADDALPPEAAKLLLARDNGLDEAEKAYLNQFVGAEGLLTTAAAATAPGSTARTQTEEEEPALNRQSTFAAALALGISEEEIAAVIGSELPAKNTLIADYCKANGLQFSTVKSRLMELLEE